VIAARAVGIMKCFNGGRQAEYIVYRYQGVMARPAVVACWKLATLLAARY